MFSCFCCYLCFEAFCACAWNTCNCASRGSALTERHPRCDNSFISPFACGKKYFDQLVILHANKTKAFSQFSFCSPIFQTKYHIFKYLFFVKSINTVNRCTKTTKFASIIRVAKPKCKTERERFETKRAKKTPQNSDQ